jgi:hypothetical protein
MASRVHLPACMALLAIAFGGGLASSGDDVSAKSVNGLVAAVTDKLSSIDWLDCEYSVQLGDQSGESIGPLIKCTSARFGRNWRHTELVSGQQGQKNERVMCFDGTFVYDINLTHQDGKDQWRGVVLREPEAGTNLDPAYLLGLELPTVGCSMMDVLKQGGVIKSEEALPDGTTGIRLLTPGVPAANAGPKSMKYDVAITLDPKHDLLPRQILITESADNITRPGWEQRWKILDYRQVLDKQTGRQRWFPFSGTLTSGSSKEPTIFMTVETVRINEAMPLSLFHPEISAGTTILDHTADKRGQVVVNGGQSKRINDVTDQANAGRSLSWIWFILAGIVALVVVIGFLWRRHLGGSILSRS